MKGTPILPFICLDTTFILGQGTYQDEHAYYLTPRSMRKSDLAAPKCTANPAKSLSRGAYDVSKLSS
jgi:hypothetical protein